MRQRGVQILGVLFLVELGERVARQLASFGVRSTVADQLVQDVLESEMVYGILESRGLTTF